MLALSCVYSDVLFPGWANCNALIIFERLHVLYVSVSVVVCPYVAHIDECLQGSLHDSDTAMVDVPGNGAKAAERHTVSLLS